MKITYNKLVRDKIPEIIEKDNKKCKTRILNDNEYIEMLKKKLIEEANEVNEAKSKDELIKELADVMEIMDGIKAACNITDEQINAVKVKKAMTNGSFKEKIFLEYVIEDK